MGFIFFTLIIVLHFCKKQRLSSLWVMILTCLFLAGDVFGIIASVQSDMTGLYCLKIVTVLEGLFIFGYQNLFPSDNLSFKEVLTERAKKLIGARRLIITGTIGSITGFFLSVIGLILAATYETSFFGADNEVLKAVTVATAGLNFVLAIIGMLVVILIILFGVNVFILGYIMLTNGLIRGVFSLYERSDKRTVLILLSCLPIINIFYAFFCLKATKLQIKAEKQCTQ